MDRQAWIAITLCVIGFIGLQVYNAQHAPPPRVQAVATPAASPVAESTATAPSASVTPIPVASATPSPAESVPAFTEKSETLSNSDVEFRLTNRGGAISDVILLNHTAENGRRVVLNSADRTPIGAIVEQPEAVALPEFVIARQSDGSVQFERKTPEGITVRKKFFLLPTTEKKDNYLAEMDVDFRNDGAQAYKSAGYFITLGSTRPTALPARPAASCSPIARCRGS